MQKEALKIEVGRFNISNTTSFPFLLYLKMQIFFQKYFVHKRGLESCTKIYSEKVVARKKVAYFKTLKREKGTHTQVRI
jgi:hypothetical protein